MSTDREKTGAFIGAYAVNPMTNGASRSGSPTTCCPATAGAIMAVPAHDERDFEFARKFELPIRYVVGPAGGSVPDTEAFTAHR